MSEVKRANPPYERILNSKYIAYNYHNEELTTLKQEIGRMLLETSGQLQLWTEET